MTLTEARAHIGDGVTYHPDGGGYRDEDGVITSVGVRWVFVRYDGDAGSKATAAAELTLLGAA